MWQACGVHAVARAFWISLSILGRFSRSSYCRSLGTCFPHWETADSVISKKSASAFAVPKSETTSSVRISSLKHTVENKSSILKDVPGSIMGMTIDERIKEAMAWTTPPLKAVELAKACSVSESAVSQWLAGITKPGIESIFAIADATGYNARWLAIEKGIRRPHRVLSVIDGAKGDKQSQVNPDLLEGSIEAVMEASRRVQKVYTASEIAGMVCAVYDIAIKAGRVDADTVKTILRLVS